MYAHVYASVRSRERGHAEKEKARGPSMPDTDVINIIGALSKMGIRADLFQLCTELCIC